MFREYLKSLQKIITDAEDRFIKFCCDPEIIASFKLFFFVGFTFYIHLAVAACVEQYPWIYAPEITSQFHAMADKIIEAVNAGEVISEELKTAFGDLAIQYMEVVSNTTTGEKVLLVLKFKLTLLLKVILAYFGIRWD